MVGKSRLYWQGGKVCKAVGFDLVIVETSGIGQGNDAITEVSDVSMYVTTGSMGPRVN